MSVEFTEEMTGFYTPGAPAYDTGDVTGRRDWNRLMFRLTVSATSAAAMAADPLHVMSARGYVRCKALSAQDMAVDAGEVRMFVPGPETTGTTMRYRLPFRTPEGPMTLVGYKDVVNDDGFDAWPDTTTLYTRLLRGTVTDDTQAEGEWARGILRIHPAMFARQMTTFRGSPADLARFGAFFARNVVRTYTAPVAWRVPA